MGGRLAGRCALLATGGLAAPSLGAADAPFVKALGHRFTRRTPALAPLETEPVPALKGLRAQCVLSLEGRRNAAKSSLPNTAFPASPPCSLPALPAPAHAGNGLSPRRSARPLPRAPACCPSGAWRTSLNGIVPRRVGQVLVKSAGIPLAKTAAELTGRRSAALEDGAHRLDAARARRARFRRRRR